jgi:hypothetical protein
MRIRGGSAARRAVLLVLATTVAALSLGATEARAGEGLLGLSCGHEASHPFMRFLDPLPYTLAPDGGFENGAAGWQLTRGARVISGNEPFDLSGDGSRSLYLPAGSSATSPPMCVQLLLPIVRFVSSGGGFLTYLQVEGVWKDARGRERSIPLLPGALPTGNRWSPTLPMLQLGGLLDALSLDDLTTEMSFRFTPRGLFGGGNWKIDSIYVDPWKRV